MDRDQLRIEALKLAHLDIYPGIKGDTAAVIERAGIYAKWLLGEHDTDSGKPPGWNGPWNPQPNTDGIGERRPVVDYAQELAAGQLEYAKQLRSRAAAFDGNMERQQFRAGLFPNRQGDASS